MKTVFVSGTFNVIHPGHQRLLKFAKSLGGKLIVGVVSDKELDGKSYINQNLRLEGVKSNINVDNAIIINTSIEKILLKLKPQIVVKGKEHENKLNEEIKVLNKYGGKLIFSSGNSTLSSVDILARELKNIEMTNLKVSKDYLERHCIKKDKLIKIVKKFSSLRVCVIGDIIIDEYILCKPIGMSQEDPTLVVTPISEKDFIGGAGIVAAHSSGLGSSTNLISVIGKDKLAKKTKKMLDKTGVHSILIDDESRPTTLKQKFRRQNHSLLKITKMQQHSISREIQEEIIKYFKKISKSTDILIFSDFNYGCLPKKLVNLLISECKKNKIFIAADSQSSSQLGDVSKFQNVDLLTPTEHEARISAGNIDDGLVVLSSELAKKTNAKKVFLKLGEEGLLIHNVSTKEGIFLTDKLNALNQEPIDTSGAGDSLLISSALSLKAGASIWEAGYIGSIASAIQVGRVGNIPLKSKEIIEYLKK